MIDLFKILFVLSAAVFLIARRVRVEWTLLLCTVLVGLLFGSGLVGIVGTVFRALVDYKTVELAATVVLITFLGALMRHVEGLSSVVSALNGLFGDVRFALMGIPAFIGLLPMPAGAMVSAPFVAELGGKAKLTPEQKTVVNYWFRHIWEYSFPLYPAIILASALLGVSYWEIAFKQFPLTVSAFVLGVFFIARRIGRGDIEGGGRSIAGNLRVLFRDVWPVVLVIAAALLFKVNLVLALVGTITLLAFARKISLRGLSLVFGEVKAASLVVLIFSVMSFKAVIEETGAVEGLPAELGGLSVPPAFIVFLIPFIVGLLTGVSFGIVGISFPIILPFVADGHVNLDLVLLAYSGGMMGLLLSPTHLCFVLTREYFNADLRKTYIMLAPLIVSMVIASAVLTTPL